MSLFHPPAWFPPQLAFLWPLIWVQVLMLRAQIRAAYGRGVVYRWSVTDNLRVYLVSIEWMPGQKKARTHLLPREHFNDRLAAACDGRAAAPAYLHLQPLSLGRGVGVRGKGGSKSVVCAAATSPLIPNPLFGRTQGVRFPSQAPGRRGFHLPLPET
ncbi:hypothetical protein [Hyphomonas jannaschiana]|uniref:hypothetical protein n=1 Tax=Hyphomonas jannaschiana TaxID=86 RepID=UPI0035C748DC